MSKSLDHIISRFDAKFLENDGTTQRIQFSTVSQTHRAVCEICESTGRLCWSIGNIVEVLK